MPSLSPAPQEREGASALWPALLLIVASAFGTALAALASPAPGAPVAVIGAPWWDQGRMVALVARAGGRLVEAGGVPNVVVVRRAADESGDLPSALYAAGAWLVLDAPALQSCLGLFRTRGDGANG